MLTRFPYRTVIFTSVLMTCVITASAYIIGSTTARNSASPEAVGWSAAATVFVIAGTWLCGAAIMAAENVAIKTLEIQREAWAAAIPEQPAPRMYDQVTEPVQVQLSPTSAIKVYTPQNIRRSQMEKLAHGILFEYKNFTVDEWTPQRENGFSKPQFKSLQEVMENNDLTIPRNNNPAGGVVITSAGMDYLIQFLAPSLRAEARYRKSLPR